MTEADRVKLTSLCRFDNSFGHDFERYFRLASVVELFAGSIKSFAHSRGRIRVKYAAFREANDHVPTPSAAQYRSGLNGNEGQSGLIQWLIFELLMPFSLTRPEAARALSVDV